MLFPNHNPASFATGGVAAGKIRAKKRRSSGAPSYLPSFHGKLLPGCSSFHPDYLAANLSDERIITILIVNHITRIIEEVQ
jgi:hypothetical protein